MYLLNLMFQSGSVLQPAPHLCKTLLRVGLRAHNESRPGSAGGHDSDRTSHILSAVQSQCAISVGAILAKVGWR